MLSSDLETELRTEAPVIDLGRIKFFGLPKGFEKKIVSDTIAFLRNEKEVDDEIKKNLDRVKNVRGEFTVFVTPRCLHCAALVRKMVQIATLNPFVSLEIVDATQFEGLQKELEITSAPTVFVNSKIRFHGKLSLAELLEIAEKAEDDEFLYEFVLKSVRDGRAADLVYLLERTASKRILSRLLEEDDLFVRLGVMYLLELMAEKGVDVDLTEELLELMSRGDGRTKEDAIMALSKIGGERELKILEGLSAENEELREAIEDAIEEIRGRL